MAMRVVHERCCGLDVHKQTVVACSITPEGRVTRTFGTMTLEILQLVGWLQEQRIRVVAMESTGVYWKPVYNLFEAYDFELLVVNAQHVKALPGRKTDVKDAEWIAELLQHGLVEGSHIPNREQRELRELVRYRTSLLQEQSAEVNRIQKVLEGANIKLSSVASSVMGVSGRAMLEALVAGTDDPRVLATLAKGQLRKKQDRLEQALAGLVGAHQRRMLRTQLEHVDFLDQKIAELSQEIEERMHPVDSQLGALDTIPGVGRLTAEVVLAEVGPDMGRFRHAANLASWAGMCPGQHESAGKRTGTRTRQGSRWLRAALVQAAHAAGRTRNTYLSAHYRRLASRLGSPKAALAVGHTILVIAYHILKNGGHYIDLGPNYFDERNKETTVRRAVKRIENLGYVVTVQPRAAGAA